MKLDPKGIRYLSSEDWRVLAAVEQGSRNHEVVPTPLIITLTNARSGSSITKSISTLAKLNLIARTKNAKYDGYRLTYGGLDYLALHAHLRSNTIYSVGNQIGVGKESDIFVVASPGGRRLVLKIHRLGRISFRTVKANRDYLRNRSSASWMYMSRLAAMKEYAFMQALRDAGFPVPEPVAQNRHTVVMELVDAFPLRMISEVPDPAELYGRLIEMILRLARFGLIHGDFNEFNILVEEHKVEAQTTETQPLETGSEAKDESSPPQENSSTTAEEATTSVENPSQPDTPPQNSSVSLNPILIDFPQMLSVSHPNAEFYFKRDVDCIKRFFSRRYGFTSDEEGPFFADAMKEVGKGKGVRRLDIEVEASGFSKKMAKELEGYMAEVGVDGDANGEGAEEEDDEDVLSPIDVPEVAGTDSLEQDEDQEAVVDSTGLSASTTDVAAVENGMTILQLSELSGGRDLELPSEPAVEPPPSVATGFGRKYAPSAFSTTGSTKSRLNTAKAAKGWVI